MASPNSRWPRTEQTTSPFKSTRGGSSSTRGRNPPAPRAPRRPSESKTAQDDPKTPSNTAAAPPPPAAPSTPKAKSHNSSRRSSRAVPPPVQTSHHLPTADIPPAPHSARPASNGRRRRGAPSGKAQPLSIHPPQAGDAMLHRPGKARLPDVPHTAPIKDTPPHLRAAASSSNSNEMVTPRPDLRNDITAAVERMRASAMAMDHTHRPSTPGSHIDWAGDDDDSLPDLDDWGVSPAVFAARAQDEGDTISPIIVDGLRPLPELAPMAYHASPLQRQVEVEVEVEADVVVEPSESPKESSPAPMKKPLHPSLPAKPSTVLAVVPPRPVAAATPMRVHPNSATHETFARAQAAKVTPPPAKEDVVVEPPTPVADVPELEAPETNTKMETQLPNKEAQSPDKLDRTPVSSATITSPAPEPETPKDPIDDFVPPSGLGASIHAPKPSALLSAGIVAVGAGMDIETTRSALPMVGSFADESRVLRSAPPGQPSAQTLLQSIHSPSSQQQSQPLHQHHHQHTHTRAHTVGRGGDRSPGMRSSRSGFAGGGQQAHLRNHSSPAAGGYSHNGGGQSYRPPHLARPKLTSGALSFLNRAVAGGGAGGAGAGGSPSPSKSQVVGLAE
ncbi:hypothetical protein BDN70DRAFT_885588 [Pholiota conissans]|uniref:Uncharacterized protein n=1 Tax=Pholiota conissans TaxID=109636 RepID=A0A9P5YTY5_9AGAR|nr:hypothetical protein BDN70DRAFT_885588 [Pholiota conissans]